MSDQATSGEPSAAPETAPAPAPTAAPVSEKPIGAFGNARGSGLSRGKRATPPPAAATASPAGSSSYKPSAVEVITPQREYTNPFASETPASVPVINEPAPQAEIVRPVEVIPAPARGSEPLPSTPMAGNEPKPSSPQPQPPASNEKAEIKILPPAEVRRPAVSWGDGTHDEDTRPQPDQRSTFRPERRDGRENREGRDNREGRENREGRSFEPREQKPFQPREPKPFQPREPRREQNFERREAKPAEAAPAPKSGGFFGWLKGLFGAKPAETPPPQPETREGQYRDGGERRHRGGRGRGNFENRGQRDFQSREPRGDNGNPNPQGGESFGQQGGGERRYEGGGGGRRRRRGGRGRYRDDRGGPKSEGSQGGGAI